jgi:Uma2 family endonuclease
MTPTTVTPPPAQAPASAGSIATTSSTSGPQPYRWTIAEYRELDKTGLFHDKKTMLLDGELYVMVMPNPPHDTALGLVEEWLRTVFTSGHHVRTQKGFDIGARTDPGPDLAVVPGLLRDYATKTPTSAVLVVEVADSSLQIDTARKTEMYATAKVPDYWVIDLPNRRLLVFRDPAPSPAGLGSAAYKTHLTLGPTDSISPLAAPNATIRIADLLP